MTSTGPIVSNMPTPGRDGRGGYDCGAIGCRGRGVRVGHGGRGSQGYRSTRKHSTDTLPIYDRSAFKGATEKMYGHV